MSDSEEIWSINESYSRRDRVIVTAVVEMTTYIVTLNLDNLVRAIRAVYSQRRIHLVEQAAERSEWRAVSHRSQASLGPSTGKDSHRND